MCYDQGVLQEYLDGEYQGDLLALKRHINGCLECREKLETLRSQEILMKNALHLGYKETAVEMEQLQINIQKRTGMKEKPMKKIHWSLKTAAAAVICGVLVFTAPGAALADQFLNIFRTQDVQAVAITPEDINELSNIFEAGQGQVEIDRIGTFESSSQGEEQELEVLTDPEILRSHLEGAKVIVPPAGVRFGRAVLTPKTEMRFTLQIEPLNDLLKTLGKEGAFPQALDGKTFSVSADRALGYSLELPEGKGTLHTAVSGMPTIGLPEGVEHKALLATLNETGLLPSGLSDKLTGLENLESVIPIPYMADRETKRDIEIKGNPAVVIQENDGSWFSIFMKDGELLYIFNGSGMTVESAIQMIETQE